MKIMEMKTKAGKGERSDTGHTGSVRSSSLKRRTALTSATCLTPRCGNHLTVHINKIVFEQGYFLFLFKCSIQNKDFAP